MRHVKPHKWADAYAGRIADAERTLMNEHAEVCASCALQRERVTRASDTFPAIRTQSSPDVSWDAVRARVHWSVSTERRAKIQPRRIPVAAWFAIGAVAAASTVVGVVVSRRGASEAPIAVAPPSVAPAHPVAVPAALVGLVSRTAGDVTIDGARGELFGKKLGAGTKLATADGHVDVQFDDTSAFALGPRSSLELRRFDAQAIELAVEGTVDVEVGPRAPGQRFLVIAGDRTVEVRGTQFRVSHDGAGTFVSCRHGLVAVRDAGGQLEVGAAKRVEVHPGRAVTDEHVVAMSADELGALARATPLALPGWASDASISAPLEITSLAHRDVRVDGIELGTAPLQLRVMPGRHTVDIADSAGRYRRAGWVDVAAAHAAHLDIPAEPTPSAGIAERRHQLKAGIDHKRLDRCVRAIAKQGLAPGYVQIELAVDAAGNVGFLNSIDTDLDGLTASCVLEVLRDVRFAPGAAATWRERIEP